MPSFDDLVKHAFVSYVREDAAVVDRLCADLRSAGIEVWLDRDQLVPGQRWQAAIRQAIAQGAFFIACFSSKSVSRESTHMNEEITLAIDELRKRSADRAWFIPIRLDDCVIPDRSIGGGEILTDLQWLDLSTDWSVGLARLCKVLGGDREQSEPLVPPKSTLRQELEPSLGTEPVAEIVLVRPVHPWWERMRLNDWAVYCDSALVVQLSYTETLAKATVPAGQRRLHAKWYESQDGVLDRNGTYPGHTSDGQTDEISIDLSIGRHVFTLRECGDDPRPWWLKFLSGHVDARPRALNRIRFEPQSWPMADSYF
jgi:hypothetical protein